MTLQRKDTIPGLVVAHFPPFDTLTTCPTCMGLACDDCCHTGAGTTVVDRQQNGGGAMTPTEAAATALRLADFDPEAWPTDHTLHADAILAAIPPGWRLCGPDDVTVTVEGLRAALDRLEPIRAAGRELLTREGYATAILAALSADKEGQK